MLLLHSVNTCLATKGSIEQCYQLKEDGKCKAVGFAAHCHCGDIIKVIEKSYEIQKPLEYVSHVQNSRKLALSHRMYLCNQSLPA